MAKANLTAGRIRDFSCPAVDPDTGKTLSQSFLWDTDTKGLAIRATPPGVKSPQGKKSFIYQGRFEGEIVRITIGDVSTYDIKKARDEAKKLAATIDRGLDPRVVKAEVTAAQTEKEAARIDAERHTFANLLDQYCDYLRELGRRSHADARSIFKNHIVETTPDLAALPANEVSPEQIADLMREVIQKGKGRTANKLRSYVRAAYQVAKASRTKASIPVAFKGYNIRTNPASDTEPDESANRPDKNPLDIGELRMYWRAIKQVDGFAGALLRLHLLTGGQRLEQFVRLRTADLAADSILLFDGKGRPGKPARPHTVPLVDAAVVALIECEPRGEFALSTDFGLTHVSAATLSEWSAQCGAVIEGFQTKRIRSGVETALAASRVSSEHRGRLQSHGISGVQSRHYDGHDYLDEKRAAL